MYLIEVKILKTSSIVLALFLSSLFKQICYADQLKTALEPDLRVFNDFNLPLDPAHLVTMSEYNLSLCLFRSMFELDEASMPISHILESWDYSDQTHSYTFKIKDDITWSDGKPLNSNDLSFSILRLKTAAPGHYSSISNLIDGILSKDNEIISHSGIINKSAKSLTIKVKKPGIDLFKRLTAVFIPIVREDQVDPKSKKIINHNVSLGPYIINNKEGNKDTLVLDKNQLFYYKHSKMPIRVEMRKYPSSPLNLSAFGTKDMWANIALDRAFVKTHVWNSLKDQGWSMWTRPIDRVMLLIPTKAGIRDTSMRELIQFLGYYIQNNPIDFKKYVGIQKASSLQPPGFILHKTIEYKKADIPKKFLNKKLKLAVVNNQLPGELITKVIEDSGLKLEVQYFPIAELASKTNSEEFDLILTAFGAADPDPVTWLSLVLESQVSFVGDWEGKLKNKFQALKKETDIPKQHASLKEMIYQSAQDGYYIPLAHFSSIAIADKNLSLKSIRQSDETVDISKIEVVRAQ